MLKYVHKFVLLLLVFFLAAKSSAQSSDPSLIFVKDGAIFWSFSLSPFSHQPLVDGDGQLRPLNISHDASRLYFAEVESESLWRVSLISSAQAFKIAAPVSLEFGVAESPQGDQVAVIERNGGELAVAFYTLNGVRQRSLAISIVQGCGALLTSPDIAAYNRQSGLNGNRLFFEWIDEAIFISRTCFGQGVQRLDLADGAVTIIHEDLENIQISPSGQSIMGKYLDSIVVMDLQGRGSYAHTDFNGAYQQFAWLSDEEIIFSTIIERDRLNIDKDHYEVADEIFFRHFTEGLPVHTLSLYRWSLPESEAELLWQSEAFYGVAHIEALEGAILMSLIEDISAVVDAINQGASLEEVQENLPASVLYQWRDNAPAELIQGEFPRLFTQQ